jgi:uncharacterized protein YydD (DUF2326 family)
LKLNLKVGVFSLNFKIDDEDFVVTRECSNQQIIHVNQKEMPLNDYRKWLESKCFIITEPTKNLTFRSLISRFIRPKKSSYTTYYKFVDEEQDYAQLLNNSFLLGLNSSLVVKKAGLKEELDNVDDMRKNIEKDPIMRSFFESDEDKHLEIDIVDLKEKIRKLERNIKDFKVAEDYYDILKEADQIKYDLKIHENRAAGLKVAIANIESSLQITPDIPKKKVLDLYREAEIFLSDAITKKLDEVEEFNKRILDNRATRLIKEKKNFEDQLINVEKVIKRLGKIKDIKLDYLNTRGALDEFTKLNEQLKLLQTKVRKY